MKENRAEYRDTMAILVFNAPRHRSPLQRSNFGNDIVKAEVQPLVEGDGAVTILVHLLEDLGPLLVGLEGSLHTQSKDTIIIEKKKTDSLVQHRRIILKMTKHYN